jgi:hypothetical protein
VFETRKITGIHLIITIRYRNTQSYVVLGESRGTYGVLVEKPEGRNPLARPRRRCEDKIKMGPREVGWGAWTRSILLRIGTGGGHLRTR